MLKNGSLEQRFGQIILASASPRRAQILSQIGFHFRTIPSAVEEIVTNHDPVAVAKGLALKKAEEIADNYPDQIVIGADTVVHVADRILGKPATEGDAQEMLRMLSGKTHMVYTAFAIVHKLKQKEVVDIESTEVTFRNLAEQDIIRYVESGAPMDKAGAYGIQDQSAIFIESIRGDFYNVVGLPISKIYACLQEQF